MYCDICGEKLDTEKDGEGIYENCKTSRSYDFKYEKDEDYFNPAVT